MRPLAALSVLLIVLALPAPSVFADTASLQQQITDKNAELQKLQKEIADYEAQLATIGSARQTLEAEIKRLDTSRKKLSADIAATQAEISAANLKLQSLADQITDKKKKIEQGTNTIESSLREIGKMDEQTLAEHFLSGETFTSAWQEADQLATVQSALQDEIVRLTGVRAALEANQTQVTEQKSELATYQKQLSGQKVVLDQNRATQSQVLTETKSKESNYQTILQQKKAAAESLQNEINSYESQLKFTFDPTKIPPAGQGILSFPLDPLFMSRCQARQSVFKNMYCITQYFGNTPFAQSGAYNGAGHNGIDIGAPEGTKVVAALDGMVVATGNTDTVRGCYSFGKWVLVKHNNGLASVYAHLSYIGVSAGQQVATGDYLGLSGQTGYATGPHLHFGLYVADAVKVVRLGDVKVSAGCSNAVVPIAPTAAYLNPIQYL